MRDGAVYVVPLRIGGGTRLKIFEAMAMGLPVVSTTVGAEGLPLTPGTHYIPADDPQAFARSIVALLRDADTRARIGDAGRALVRARYDWSAVAATIEEALARFSRPPAAASPSRSADDAAMRPEPRLISLGER
jgi:glycosyltransferase involved in cell wall biosynthesis